MNSISENISFQIAEELLRIGAFSISTGEPYVWASGMLAPIYTDNRLAMSYPEVRKILTDAFIEQASGYDFDCVAGVATAGIPHAAWVADRLSLPLVYVRPEAKGHGKGNQIEGFLRESSKVLIIEDLVATGLSSIQVVEAMEEAIGAPPVLTLAIFSYQLPRVSEYFTSKGTLLKTLCNFDILLDVAVKIGYIDAEARESLLEWRRSYGNWTANNW
ncbi:MAG: orotate phosphoribosyltransferase [Bacteroidetes bacterium]|nr:orotate phosphoribosyltransferase [Bacteroidota bacterium]MCY4206169.1 orotate phosphoribosyltransferase [Bacteroidota bacterium]